MRNQVSGVLAAILLTGLLLSSASAGFAREEDDVDLTQIPDSVLLRWWRILNDETVKGRTAFLSQERERFKRSLTNHRPNLNLSITNQIDVLRHRLMLEMNRRRTEYQIKENKKILETLGKRRKRHLAGDYVREKKAVLPESVQTPSNRNNHASLKD